jgi:S1-C subfamily serine protease
MVLTLENGAPAERGGVLPGDILMALDGQSTPDTDDVQGALEKHRPGDVVQAVLVRGGERRELSITLAERRAD